MKKKSTITIKYSFFLYVIVYSSPKNISSISLIFVAIEIEIFFM